MESTEKLIEVVDVTTRVISTSHALINEKVVTARQIFEALDLDYEQKATLLMSALNDIHHVVSDCSSSGLHEVRSIARE